MRALVPHLERRVDGRAVGIARIIIGLSALVKGTLVAADLYQLRSGEFIKLPYPWQPVDIAGFGPGLVLTTLWLVFALFFMLGFGSRISGTLLALTIFLVMGIDQQLYSNHLYLLGMVVALLTIAGPGGNYSVARWFGSPDQTVPRWSTELIRIQLTSVYFFAAVTKLNQDFLSGDVLELALESSMQARITEFVALSTMASVAVTIELFLAFAFWFRNVRWLAIPVAVGFHVGNVLLMDHGGMVNFAVFGAIMAAMVLMHFTDVISGGAEQPGISRPVPAGTQAVAMEGRHSE